MCNALVRIIRTNHHIMSYYYELWIITLMSYTAYVFIVKLTTTVNKYKILYTTNICYNLYQ